MALEEDFAAREKRQRESYARLKNARPELYRKAVEIGSLASILGVSLKNAAKIEGAVVSLLNEALDL